MGRSGILKIVGIMMVALFIVAGIGSASATNPNAGCNQTPYENSSGNGANHSGAYDDTCDGSAAENGNGDGSAAGKPCAGCVGEADEKNPPGQDPDGSDENAGYECDTNSGIGRTNPAHTGCASSTEENPPGENTPPDEPGAEVLGRKFLAETGGELAVLAAVGLLLVVSGANLRLLTARGRD